MFSLRKWLSLRPSPKGRAREIYGSIVASARQKTFYADWQVPDSREGRFEVLILQVAVIMLRLGRAGPEGAGLGRALGEAFVEDMDDNMREIGIGDLAVPRKIKKVGAALMDRHRDYGAALSAADTAELSTHIEAAFTNIGGKVDVVALTAYTERMWGALQVVSDADCCAGRLPLPWPAETAQALGLTKQSVER